MRIPGTGAQGCPLWVTQSWTLNCFDLAAAAAGRQDPTYLIAKNQNRKQKECCNKFNKNLQWPIFQKISKTENPTCATDYEYVDCKLLIAFRPLWSAFSAQRDRSRSPSRPRPSNRANVCTSCLWWMRAGANSKALRALAST